MSSRCINCFPNNSSAGLTMSFLTKTVSLCKSFWLGMIRKRLLRKSSYKSSYKSLLRNRHLPQRASRTVHKSTNPALDSAHYSTFVLWLSYYTKWRESYVYTFVWCRLSSRLPTDPLLSLSTSLCTGKTGLPSTCSAGYRRTLHPRKIPASLARVYQYERYRYMLRLRTCLLILHLTLELPKGSQSDLCTYNIFNFCVNFIFFN